MLRRLILAGLLLSFTTAATTWAQADAPQGKALIFGPSTFAFEEPSSSAGSTFEKFSDAVLQPQESTDKQVADETTRLAEYTYWLAVFTLLLFTGAVGQIILFAWQLWLMRASLQDAKTSSDAAKSSADTAKLAMIVGSRAYVHHSGMRWISHKNAVDGRIFWRLRPSWINQGATPTRSLHVFIHYEFRDNPLPEDYQFNIPDDIESIPTTIAPKSKIESAYFDIFGEDLAAVSKQKKYLYIWGVAKYRDVFPGTDEYITKFCIQAAAVMGDPLKSWEEKDNPVDITFSTHPRHNCVDDECA